MGNLFSVFAWRFVVALLLVCLTWNPTRYSYVAWAGNHIAGAVNAGGWSGERRAVALIAFVGVVLLIAWLFYLRTAARSLGAVGVILAAGLCATIYCPRDLRRGGHAERHGARLARARAVLGHSRDGHVVVARAQDLGRPDGRRRGRPSLTARARARDST